MPETKEEVRHYLEEEYTPGKTFEPDRLLTVYMVEYLADEERAAD